MVFNKEKMMNWQIKGMNELTARELYEILKVREEVFIVEQNCIYHDIDFKDELSHHLFLENEQKEVVACCRIIPRGISYPEVSIGRVLTKATHRKTGLGKEMMQRAIDFIEKEWQETEIRISGQLYLLEFYKSLGFEQVSEVYLEDNQDHIELLYKSR